MGLGLQSKHTGHTGQAAGRMAPSRNHVTVASEPERNGVFLTRSCVHVTDISCGVVYEATLASLVLFRSYCYVAPDGLHDTSQNEFVLINFTCTSMSFVDLNFAGHQEIKPYRTFM